MEKTFHELPHWTFHADEVSAGRYRVKGANTLTDANLEISGEDPERLFDEAKIVAEDMDQQMRHRSQGPD